nr:dipeptidase PepV [uncultured Dorea sp.]
MNFEKQIQADKKNLIKDIITLTSMNSVEAEAEVGKPFGEGPAKALQCFLDMAEEMGLKVENFDNYAGHAEYGDGEETLGILGHVDVVPCSGEWLVDPFEPEVKDGKIYGRGVLDDKGPMVACLHAVKILKEMNLPLSKKIRFIIGANEETDWRCMDYYFNQKKMKAPEMSFTPDASFPVIYAEKGVFHYQLVTDIKEKIVLSGGIVINSVADRAYAVVPDALEDEIKKNLHLWEEKTKCRFRTEKEENGIRLEAEGFAAHAVNVAKGINAITGVMYAVSELDIQGELAEIAKFYMEHIGFDTSGERLGINVEDSFSGKLSFNVGKVEVKHNQVIFSIDNRVPVEYSCEDVQKRLEEKLKGSRFRFELLDITKANYVPKDSFLVQTLMDVYREITGDTSAEARAEGTCSYARAVKNCVAFGALLPDQPDLMHQTNEYVELDKLDVWMKIYLEAIYRLAK